MSDITAWLKEIAASPALLKEIYGDLAKPGVSQVGKAIGTVVGLGNTLLLPIALLNDRARIAYETNLERYREKLKDVPEADIVDVTPEIGVPVIEKLGYVTDPNLSELYLNLLAKASVKQSCNLAHPSFVNVINNLSPDEAVLLQHLQQRFGFLEVRLKQKNLNEWRVLGQLLTGLERKADLTFPQNLVAYFSNFEGLGLITIRDDCFIVEPGVYEALEEQYRPLFEKFHYDHEKQELQFVRGKVDVTPFGSLFITACIGQVKPE